MILPNRLPDLDADKTKDKKIIYGLYSVNKYDDGHEDAQYCVELADSIEELDKKAQTIIKNHKSHCESNKTFIPYSLVIRKVKHTIESEIAEEYKEHFIPDFELKNPECKNCGGHIAYGDEVHVYNNQKFCSPECITEYIKVRCIESGEDDYDKLFKGE
jgi:hypothetical protein